ncbi:MAG: CBS domain-containing protein [Clostridia bacterium]|nr:CBS domain-containing protein [Clostridia bacterium]
MVGVVRKNSPVRAECIAKELKLTPTTLNPDLKILTIQGILAVGPSENYSYNGSKKDSNLSNVLSSVLNKIRVKDIKSLPIVINDTGTIYDAAVLMFTEDVGTLFIVNDGGALQGVVSRKDLLKAALSGINTQETPLNMAMTRMPNIITVSGDETVFMAAKKIVDYEVDVLPVVRNFYTKSGEERLKVVGKITKTSLAKLIVDLGEGKRQRGFER